MIMEFKLLLMVHQDECLTQSEVERAREANYNRFEQSKSRKVASMGGVSGKKEAQFDHALQSRTTATDVKP